MKKNINHYFVSLFFYFLLSDNAHAYLDPGTGSVILQAIIAFFAGVAAWISLYWKKFKNFITNLFSNTKKKE
tara:strand:- start:28 stop:243 length:216 start_codon:yes stop_codon:yes gene_type:complete